MTHKPMVYLPPTDLSPVIGSRALAYIDAAWQAIDDMHACGAKRNFTQALEHLSQVFSQAAGAVAVLFSGNPDERPDLALLKRLIGSDAAFGRCDVNALDRLQYWQTHPEKRKDGQRPSADWRRMAAQAAILVKAVETYHFDRLRRIYGNDHLEIERKRRIRILQRVLLTAAAIVLILYPLYRGVRPVLHFETKGQFFWRQTANQPESEVRSLRFKVYADNRFHDYVIDTTAPVNLVALRFDPVVDPGARVWIDSIRLFEDGRAQPVTFNFDQGRGYWIAVRDIGPLQISDGCLVFDCTGKDPVLKKRHLTIERLNRIEVRMKVRVYKSYVQWLLS